jgi:hypothetical protein
MKNRQKTKMTNRKRVLKPLVLTLLCLCLVALFAVLPGILVNLSDEDLYDRFIPTGGAPVHMNNEENALHDLEDSSNDENTGSGR